jgi:hypothetical protein
MLFPAASFLTLLPTPWSCMTRGLNPCSFLLQQGFASRQPPKSSKHPLHHHINHTLRWIQHVQALFSSSYCLLALQCTRSYEHHTHTHYCTSRFSVRGGQLGPARTRLVSNMPLISFASYSCYNAPFSVLLFFARQEFASAI